MPPALISSLRRRLRASWQEGAVALKALSFALVGAVNTVIDFGVFMLAYAVLGLSLIPANLTSWLVAVSGSYVMNSYTTFAAESGRKLRWRSYFTFVLSGVAGAIGNTVALVVGSHFMPVVAAKICAIAVSFLINFSISHLIVFRPARSEGVKPG